MEESSFLVLLFENSPETASDLWGSHSCLVSYAVGMILGVPSPGLMGHCWWPSPTEQTCPHWAALLMATSQVLALPGVIGFGRARNTPPTLPSPARKLPWQAGDSAALEADLAWAHLILQLLSKVTWTSNFTSLSLSFPIYKVGLLVAVNE